MILPAAVSAPASCKSFDSATIGTNTFKCCHCPARSSPIVSILSAGKKMTLIYKICRASDWQEAAAQGTYRGSGDDHRDGFIHLSAGHQVQETARRYFAGQSHLILIAFDAKALEPMLKWEPSRGGDLFPHVYGTIA